MDEPLKSAEEGVLYAALAMIKVHFLVPGRIVDDRNQHQMIDLIKDLVSITSKSVAKREACGLSQKLWKALNEMMDAAAIYFLKHCFATTTSHDYHTALVCGSPDAELIGKHFTMTTQNLERMLDLCTLSTNIVAGNPRAQNLAYDSRYQHAVLGIIDICIRATTNRSYDGELDKATEKKWENVTKLFKRLLIKSLKFIMNSVQQNEARKHSLWLDLFAESENVKPNLPGPDNQASASQNSYPKFIREKPIPFPVSQDVRQRVGDFSPEFLTSLPQKPKRRAPEMKLPGLSQAANKTTVAARNGNPSSSSRKSEKMTGGQTGTETGNGENQSDAPGDLPRHSRDYHLDLPNPVTVEEAIERTEKSKEYLLKELGDNLWNENILCDPEGDGELDNEIKMHSTAGQVEDKRDNMQVEELGAPIRGLLTEIPLILEPHDIDILPMIVSAGVAVTGTNEMGTRHRARNLDGPDPLSLRCNMFLASEKGRNLFREMLIYVALWDLSEDELYFKLMLQIMESVLEEGLAPFLYDSFHDSQELVACAQSVIIKILTSHFKSQRQPGGQQGDGQAQTKPFTNAESLVVQYFFRIFRSEVLPGIRTLLYLQSQIRNGVGQSDLFPLGLLEMDRCYEGIYQYLEFFSVLCEHEHWKILLIKWDFAYELVSLLQDLSLYIPKGEFIAKAPKPSTSNDEARRREAQDTTSSTGPPPVAVERPYDPVADSEPLSPSRSEAEQDAWEFTWSNLKKLNILVLAALVWHCPTVQAQVRHHDGIDTILNCCGYDSHNLYIKEHAIVCLRSLLEYNVENQKLIAELQKIGKVPAAVLEDEKCREHLNGGRVRPVESGTVEEVDDEDDEDDEDNLFW